MKLIIDIPKIVYDRIIKGYEISEDIDLKWIIKNGTPLESEETSDLKIKISKLEHDNESLKNIVKNLIKTLASKGLITNIDSIFKKENEQ